MASRRTTALLIATAVAVGGGWLLVQRGAAASEPEPSARALGDRHYSAGDLIAAKSSYETFVAEFRHDPDPGVQDEVAIARLRLGYVAAKDKDFEEARRVLLEASEEYRGNGHSSDYGTLPEQARYQAAVCLAAQGNTVSAEKAFVEFITDNGMSPLAHAAFRRLQRLNGGTAKPEHEALIQKAVTERESHIRRQKSLCGPKSIKQVLKLLKRPDVDLEVLARQCSMDDTKGTTMAGMIAGLGANGLSGTGIKLAYRDLGAEKLPLIWLDNSHYLVIIEAHG